ncbi:substrate-binding domain-containing protein [Rhodococcus globerulus]|uniref:substrate-binding domain-containing protein n=1 Tax=Rhodococcus globerulus TaxID=33008 RepID=UPI002164FD74|nr:substrate-binding domain-containing protein [Rhodococcus globerulus]
MSALRIRRLTKHRHPRIRRTRSFRSSSAAPAAARAALDLGLSIPGSILIAQNSDEPALLISDPPITAVDFFPEEQAVLAVDALLALINGDEPRNQGHTRSELRIRASTDRAVGT